MEEVTQSASIPTTTDDFDYEVKGLSANETKNEGGGGVAEDESLRELSSELQQLLQPLEARIESSPEHGQSLGWIDLLDEGKHTRILHWLFDTADKSYKSRRECTVLLGAQAKLRLLQAIGSCRTLRKIDVRYLTGNELEALLTPMQSNPVLDLLHIDSRSPTLFAAETASAANERVERICEILGRILHTSRTLKYLSVYLTRFTAAGVRYLASGVRGNAESALEEFAYAELLKSRFSIGDRKESGVANQVAEIVLSAPRLRTLKMLGGVIDDDGVDALAKALAKSTSLRGLELFGVERGAAALLLKAFTGSGSNQSIDTLRLTGVMEGMIDLVPQLLSAIQSLKELVCDFRWKSISPDQWRSATRWLSSSSSLEVLRVAVRPSSFLGRAIDGGEGPLSSLDLKNSWVGLYVNSNMYDASDKRFNPWFFPSEWRDDDAEELLRDLHTGNPIIEFHMSYSDFTGYSVNLCLAEALSSEVTHLSFLYLQMEALLPESEEGHVDNFFQALRSSSTLRLLTLVDTGRYWAGGWTRLIDCLRSNTSISHLRLINWNYLDENEFKLLMGVLQVNFTLKRIWLNGTPWETDGKKALIQEALRRNAEQDSYFSTFRRHGLKFQTATNGRLFLCGSPYAGKTRLRKTMTRILPGTSCFGVAAAQLWRTQGVEVKVLKDDEEMHIAVWDLAGQCIFRTLQNILFPQTNHTSIFLFVFSPYDRENGCIREELAPRFKTELDDWLRFIASNSQIIGRMLPKVLVVISHMDKMQGREFLWAKSIVKELGEEFRNILDVCENLYQVNACSKSSVTPLKDYIFKIFRDMLKNNSPIAPIVCAQISSLLAKRKQIVKHRPLWSSQEFYRFCSDNLHHTRESLKPDTANGLEVFKAMASYLQDTGSIIIISSLDKIIVDPNWLTNVFLGELITMGHNFQVNSKAVQKSKTDLLFSKTGLVSSSDLELLLSSFMCKHPEFSELNSNLLEDLLIFFELCYKLGSGKDAQYYIPTIVCEDDRGLDTGGWRTRESLSWSPSSESNQQFIGFRVECENTKTMSMTAALFPRFQIYMRQKLIGEMELTDESVICFRNYMRLHMDGHEIVVENSDMYMVKSHIDVMVKCSQHKSREMAVKYIKEHIIEELRKFCASPKGCPGIVLVVGVLRTECVEKLVPLAHRAEDQAILIWKLKEKFEADFKKHVEGTTTGSFSSSSSYFLNYEHFWPPIPGILPKSFELAKELLSDEIDQAHFVSEVVTKVGKLKLATEVGDPCCSSPNTTPEGDREELGDNIKWSNRRRRPSDVIPLNDEVFEIHAPLEGGPLVELVFVHGMVEDETILYEKSYLTTWSTRNNRDECWINTWLVSQTIVDLQRARILTVSLDLSTRKTDSSGNMDCFQIAENLTQTLITMAHVGQQNCPVVLVGHCLGGVVLKEVCVQAQEYYGNRSLRMDQFANFLTNLKGLFFYSTPHLGFSREFERTLELRVASSSSEYRRGDMIESSRLLDTRTSRDKYRFDHLREKYGWKTRAVGESNKTEIPVLKIYEVCEAEARSVTVVYQLDNVQLEEFSKSFLGVRKFLKAPEFSGDNRIALTVIQPSVFLQGTESAIVETRVVEEASAREGCFLVIPNTDHFTICRPETVTSDSFLYLVDFVKSLLPQDMN